VTGPVGVGLGTIVRYIAGSIVKTVEVVLPEKDEKVDLEKGVISVESIRRLYTQTRSVHIGKQVIVIDYAERMGHQAQNAFLKLLEEPAEGVYFIIATHSPTTLLPTILSRCRQVVLRPLTHAQSEVFLDQLDVKGEKKRTQLLFMADGLPAELTRLSSDEAYFESRSSIVRDAREILQSTVYQKLKVINTYKDDREAALRLLDVVSNILERSIRQKPQDTLIRQIDALLYARQQIQANGNIRLCLARLVV
jgi:DNA polymerase-3 subunit delta'